MAIGINLYWIVRKRADVAAEWIPDYCEMIHGPYGTEKNAREHLNIIFKHRSYRYVIMKTVHDGIIVEKKNY